MLGITTCVQNCVTVVKNGALLGRPRAVSTRPGGGLNPLFSPHTYYCQLLDTIGLDWGLVTGEQCTTGPVTREQCKPYIRLTGLAIHQANRPGLTAWWPQGAGGF